MMFSPQIPLSSSPILSSDYLKTAVILDLGNNSVYLQEVTTYSPFFPLSSDNLIEARFQCAQATDIQVVATTRYKDIPIWRLEVLSTRKLEWCEIKVEIGTDGKQPFTYASRDGSHMIFATMTREVGNSRLIDDDEVVVGGPMRRFQLIRNAMRVSSLLRLATIAVQKSGRVSRQQLIQIAERTK
ncbi:hypothetical protein PENTCL1PPCAC_11246 [Pristionchus entomophagus]|uniref:Uncharacterized protein n=1 Tax=Pristionchus entomophagus TaxID=358040 RepID=A0AAV5T9N0_9BILA|nr:hypothetical protein PENTCL1PPCAC_11245 [Pristionchus entomophagus]GMS89071.1 hypothetical protein PENTCL1PPCAC_11246 [Pristionchus entomophagus]